MWDECLVCQVELGGGPVVEMRAEQAVEVLVQGAIETSPVKTIAIDLVEAFP
jgi:hypothetical protein